MHLSKDTEGVWGFEYKQGTDLTGPMKENCLFLSLNRLELVNHAHILQGRCQALLQMGQCCEMS